MSRMVGGMPFPIVRLTLDGMKAQIMQCMVPTAEWQEALSKEIDAAIAGLDVAAIAREAATKIIGEAIKDNIKSAVHEVMWQPELRGELAGMVGRAVRDVFASRTS